MSDSRRGFFAYPWDLADAGPEDVLNEMSEKLGCNSIALNAIYHTARLLRPRATGAKMLQRPGALAAFQPNDACYTGTRLRPPIDRDLAAAHPLEKTADTCTLLGMDFGLWLVALHNSSLGKAFPELCVRNCFGDIYPYSLCPRQTEVRTYVGGLVSDVCAQFGPQRIILEAVGYLGLRHGEHHELAMTLWDDRLELLTGLCFCPECLAAGDRAGIDARVVQTGVRHLAGSLLDEESSGLDHDVEDERPEALLTAVPQLGEYVRCRNAAVTELVAEAATAAHRKGARIETIAASFHRPASRAWLEGADMSEIASHSDAIFLPTYTGEPAEIAADIAWARERCGRTPISAALLACPPTCTNRENLEQQAHAARDAGAQAIYYYNYGMLTTRRLGWVAAANRNK